MEFFVGLALVFSGLILGYRLWYTDRSEDDQLIRKLKRENDDMKMSLKLAHNSHAKLDERFNRQQGQLHVLQQLCDDWSQNREQHERERADLEALSAEQSKRADELRSELESEKQRRMKLEDQQHALTQANLEKVAEIESSFRSRFQTLEAGISDKTTRIEKLIAENERLKHRIVESEAQHEKACSELNNQQQLLQTAISNRDGLRQEYVSLESALSDKAKEISQLASEKREALAKCQSVEEAMTGLNEEIAQLQEERNQLRDQAAQLGELTAQVETLEATKTTIQEQLEVVTAQRDASIESESSAQTAIAGLQKRLDNQEATIHRLRARYDDALQKHKSDLDQQVQLETQLATLEQELEASVAQQEASAETHTGIVVQLTQQRDSFAAQLDELQNEVAAQLERQSEAVRQLTMQRDQFADQLRRTEEETATVATNHQSRIDELVVECEQTKQRCDQLVEQVRVKEEELVAVALNHQTRIDELVVECEQATCQRDEISENGRQLAEQCEQLTSVCASLEDQLQASTITYNMVADERDSLLDQVIGLTEQVKDLETHRERLLQERQIVQQQEQQGRFDMTEQIETLRDQRDVLLNELAATRENHANASASLRDASTRIDSLTTKIQELDTQCQRIHELEKLVQERDRQDQQTADELQTLREQYANVYSERESLKSLVDELSEEQGTWQQAHDESAAQLTSLQNKLRSSEETIRNLRKERAAVLARYANHRSITEPDSNVISFTEAMAIRAKNELDYDAEYGGPIRTHATRGTIYTEPPKEVDNLKRISGIAEVLEARLNDYGVYTFKQIMEWKQEAVDEFSHLLSFRDRITRDDWIGQAAKFYEEKQNTPKTFAA